MSVHKKIQLNVYLDNSTDYNIFYPSTPRSRFYPILIADEHSEETDDYVRQYNTNITYNYFKIACKTP